MGAAQGGTDVMGRVFARLCQRQMAAIGLLVVGLGVAALVATMPQASLDLLMWRLWLPQMLAAATPPIGATGRTLLALLALLPFVGLAGVAWMIPAGGVRRPMRRAAAVASAPAVRRSDAHPDAPPRRPIRANEDLGAPLPIVTMPRTRRLPEPERPLPADLDQPLAAFDPIAVPDVPREPVRAVAPLVAAPAPVVVAGAPESLSFLAIAPEPEPEAAPVVAEPVAEPEWLVEVHPVALAPLEPEPELQPRLKPEPQGESPVAADASIASLLERLERGARKRAEPEAAPAASLDDTLVMLRRLAAG
jgi:hypothetical protein